MYRERDREIVGMAIYLPSLLPTHNISFPPPGRLLRWPLLRLDASDPQARMLGVDVSAIRYRGLPQGGDGNQKGELTKLSYAGGHMTATTIQPLTMCCPVRVGQRFIAS